MRVRNHCQGDHHSWQANGRYIRNIAEASRQRRMHADAAKVAASSDSVAAAMTG